MIQASRVEGQLPQGEFLSRNAHVSAARGRYEYLASILDAPYLVSPEHCLPLPAAAIRPQPME